MCPARRRSSMRRRGSRPSRLSAPAAIQPRAKKGHTKCRLGEAYVGGTSKETSNSCKSASLINGTFAFGNPSAAPQRIDLEAGELFRWEFQQLFLRRPWRAA